jgi:hypothetical protein
MCARGLRRWDQHAARDVCRRYVPQWSVGAAVCSNALGGVRGEDTLGIVTAMTHSNREASGGRWLGKSGENIVVAEGEEM